MREREPSKLMLVQAYSCGRKFNTTSGFARKTKEIRSTRHTPGKSTPDVRNVTAMVWAQNYLSGIQAGERTHNHDSDLKHSTEENALDASVMVFVNYCLS